MPELTPDEAIDTLRSLVFEHERHLVDWTNISQETAESITEHYHEALVVLQRYVDAQEVNDGEEVTLP
jgi:hypothetical protein